MIKNKLSVLLLLAMTFISCKAGETNESPAQPAPETASRPTSFASDDAMLDYIEKVHLNYMWDGADPTSGMAYERIHLDNNYPENDRDVVTLGGSGFGVAGLLVGIDRGFINRSDGVARLTKIVNYLSTADRFMACGLIGFMDLPAK